MDMDGIGTMALFLRSGAIGMGLILLAGYRMRLKASLEQERLRQSSPTEADELREEIHDLVERQGADIAELHERLDFAERLLTKGKSDDA